MLQEFDYRVSFRAGSHHPGHHPSRATGAGLEFKGLAPLLAAPDPRRLDIRASLLDPWAQWRVRVYRQKSSIPVWLLADLSASMGFVGRRRKLDVLADFATSLGYSTYRTGDPMGFAGCDTTVRQDFLSVPRHGAGVGLDLAQRLRRLEATGTGAGGLARAVAYLGRERALVFLASDFHFPFSVLEEVLASLWAHDLVPLVLWDRAEFADLPRFGLADVCDSESGRRRIILMRASLRQRIRDRYAARREELTRLFAAHHCRPLFIFDEFRADAMSAYFHAQRADAL